MGDRWTDAAVVIPAWNHGVLLGEALSSVRAQSMQPGAVVVVDDGSTDDTPTVCSEFDVKYVRQEHAGVAAAVRRGFAETTEPWVFLLGADDLMGDDFIARHRATLEAYTGTAPVGVVYSEAIVVNLDGDCIGYFGGEAWVPGAIQRQNFVHGAALVSRAAWLTCGGTQEEPHEDWALWKRMDSSGYVGLLADGTRLTYRQHEFGHRNYGSDAARDRDWCGQTVRGVRVPNIRVDAHALGVRV